MVFTQSLDCEGEAFFEGEVKMMLKLIEVAADIKKSWVEMSLYTFGAGLKPSLIKQQPAELQYINRQFRHYYRVITKFSMVPHVDEMADLRIRRAVLGGQCRLFRVWTAL